jgi:hypothetical protein
MDFKVAAAVPSGGIFPKEVAYRAPPLGTAAATLNAAELAPKFFTPSHTGT